MYGVMKSAPLDCVVPQVVPGFTMSKVLIMSRINGYKVTDKLALAVHSINRQALVIQIAHCCAFQLFNRGIFNGAHPFELLCHVLTVSAADPHPGNIFFCLQSNDVTDETRVVPGLLDFGMTVRLTKVTRLLYCELILALFEGNMELAAGKLRLLGYSTNQSHRAPERDAQFFEFLLRDAMVGPGLMRCAFSVSYPLLQAGNASKIEQKSYNALRDQQREADIQQAVREKGGRSITSLPQDFLYITRVIGLLRGLAVEMNCDCPILYILALHAKAGLHV